MFTVGTALRQSGRKADPVLGRFPRPTVSFTRGPRFIQKGV